MNNRTVMEEADIEYGQSTTWVLFYCSRRSRQRNVLVLSPCCQLWTRACKMLQISQWDISVSAELPRTARFGIAVSKAWFQDAFYTVWIPARDTHFTWHNLGKIAALLWEYLSPFSCSDAKDVAEDCKHSRECSFKSDFLQAWPDKSPFACINLATVIK